MFGELFSPDLEVPDYSGGFSDVASNLSTTPSFDYDIYSPQFESDVAMPNLEPAGGGPSLGPDLNIAPTGQQTPGADVTRGPYGGPGETPGGGPYSVNETINQPEGGGDWWSGIGDVAKKVTPWAQLGLQGLGAAQGVYGMVRGAQQQGIQREAQRRQSEIARQQQQQAAMSEQRGGETYGAGREAYDRAMRGEVPSAIQQQIENWKRGAKQMAASRAAGAGQGQSSMLTQWEQWIDQQGEAMKGQWLQSQMDYYLKAGEQSDRFSRTGVTSQAGAGTTSQQQIAGTQQEQQSLEKLIQSANNIIARLSAST